MTSPVKGVLDLTFLDISDESNLLINLTDKNLNKTVTITNETIDNNNTVKKSNHKDIMKALKLSNNKITNINIILSNNIKNKLDYNNILWLDLSFNIITDISIDLLKILTNLTTLYLHANKISKLSNIKNFIKNVNNPNKIKLKSLSMYGNPIEENKHYKKYILYHLPTLTQFDSSLVTKQDRKLVEVWSQTYRKILSPEEED